MEGLVSYDNAQCDIDQDELSLIWISSSGDKSLKLASVLRIIAGQKTAVFQRYLRPEKDYLSFSLIYKNGKQSLDLICKDKVEAEAWIAGLRAVISSGQRGRSKIDGWNEGLYFDESRYLTSNSASGNSASALRDINSLEVPTSFNTNISHRSSRPEKFSHSDRSYAAIDQSNMQVKGHSSDVLRVSVSSAPSTSSHGSAPDDCDALGDVYIWGEVICDNHVSVGADNNANFPSTRTDVLLPRPLESNVVLDVHHIACGVRHAALVTRQGEVFTWGEESGGCLGHGFGSNVIQPRLVEASAFSNVDFVSCGEFHTCAVTLTGELYTWGDGTHNAGLLGHGSGTSHWMPKRISGPLEGLHVASVTCGPWHTALITLGGQLFTFGDGTFGVLGHGDRESVNHPREVESLSGLRTISVACGVWHTAAVVEVIMTRASAGGSSGKLFTWGDGDKNRLGHGDKEPRVKPTCVPALIDYDFRKVACGHSLTVGLTTSGSVFTMGSTVYGQLGNLSSDGKLPCLVEDMLLGECVEVISCGAYHVAVLTSRNEVYTWGKGANGRLGHGDIKDCKTPTLVESLKDRHVKYIACGANYSAAICLHKWVSGAEQFQCSTCRQAFGFTRKRHNCYNCGLVHCHSCSSRKALKAAMAPNPNKPYRVCDSCYAKLQKVSGISDNLRKVTIPRLSGENKDNFRLLKSGVPCNLDLIKQLDNKAAKGKMTDPFLLVGSGQSPPSLQLKDGVSSMAVDLRQGTSKPILTPSGASSRPVSPFSRKTSPPRSVTPIPTTSGLAFSKSIADSMRKTNELLNQEVLKLRSQVVSLRHRCQFQEFELKRSMKRTQEAMVVAAEESAKSKAAKEVIKSLTAQLKDMAERLPPVADDTTNPVLANLPNGLEPNGIHYPDTNVEGHLRSDWTYGSSREATVPATNATRGPARSIKDPFRTTETNVNHQSQGLFFSNGEGHHPSARLPYNNGSVVAGNSSMFDAFDARESAPLQYADGTRSWNSQLASNSEQVEVEWIEQYELGVFITLVALRDGSRDLKRVRFSRRRFGEHQAETWWSENRQKVYERYGVRGSDKSSVLGQALCR